MNNLFFNNLKKNKKGTALFMALMILSGVLIISLGAASLMMSGLKQGRTQAYSTKAYYVAEAGAERVLWEIRKNGFNVGACSVGQYVNFDDINDPPNYSAFCDGTYSVNLSNSSKYFSIYKGNAPISFDVVGDYSDVKRSIEISY